MTTRSVTVAALLATLARPSWWILALAGFLVRGGIVLFGLAIVTLPSPLALSNVLRPVLTPLYFGRLEPATAALIVALVVAALASLFVGSWLGAATEVTLIREAQAAARDEHLPGRAPVPGGLSTISRAAVAHLLALVPLAFGLAIVSLRVFDVVYAELTNPSDAGPIVLRVVIAAAGPLGAVLALWIAGEIVGGVAVRRLVLGGGSILGALGGAVGELLRRPVASLAAPLSLILVLALDVGAVLAVVSIAWNEVRERLIDRVSEPLATTLSIGTFAAAWCLALVVTGLIASWRSAAMTLESERLAAANGTLGSARAGTIGASPERRPGDWSTDDPGGSL